ncbi:CG0192-related protein [Aeromicrobium sp.]|uniref:CG0192-related protein n=1 Tax=Aeromicrobium sp. TaxID=1871063 RepID=UPI003C4B30A5
MALLHAAELTPSKIELIRSWLPSRPWYSGEPAELELIAAYRFDDPDGEVGVETHLVGDANGPTHQVPLTYRGAPLAGADEWLVGMMQHSVLGDRWVYDACGDPVYAQTLATAILTGGTQAALEVDDHGHRSSREPSARVNGSGQQPELGTVGLVDVRDDGGTTVVVTSVAEIVVRRVINAGSSVLGEDELVGSWPGVSEPTVLAVSRPVA